MGCRGSKEGVATRCVRSDEGVARTEGAGVWDSDFIPNSKKVPRPLATPSPSAVNAKSPPRPTVKVAPKNSHHSFQPAAKPVMDEIIFNQPPVVDGLQTTQAQPPSENRYSPPQNYANGQEEVNTTTKAAPRSPYHSPKRERNHPVKTKGSPRQQSEIESPGTEELELPVRPPPSDVYTKTFDEAYIKGRELGSGAFAKVFIGIDINTQQKFAVKQIDRAKMKWSGRDAMQDEIQNLKKLREAPNVVKLQDCFEEEKLCYLVLELLPGGELFERIIQKGVYMEQEARDSCRCILSALDYMHDRRIVHRDLKPENLLLVDTIDIWPVKLADFGFSKTITKKNECRTLCGTPGYLAPEILERWPAYDVKCDTFSFGVILFLLLGGYLPFDAHESKGAKDVFERTRNGQYQFYPKRWSGISHLAKDLVAKCLTVNPNKRISAKAALNHEWMAEKLLLPRTQISLESLTSTVKRAEKAKEDRRKEREATNKPLDSNRLQELNDDFTVYLETRQADSIVSHVTGAGRTVGTVATQFKEDSPSGLPFNDFYQKGDQLGRGSFAAVYRCRHRRTGMQYAIKEVVTTKLNKAEISTLHDEIMNLKYLRGAPHIIRLYDVFSEPDKTYLIFEEMRGGDLLHRICDKEVYTEREARDLCKILFYAVDYCHKKRIAHRDIKLDNLLLLEEGNDASIKLADFGFSKKVTRKSGLRTMCGTPNYMAPEIYNSRIVGYNYLCDMWSVGVVVYCLLGGYLPFEGSSLKDLTAKVISGEYYFHDEYWKSISPSAKKMILGLLQTDPRQRLTAEQALSCTWMGMDDEELSVMDLSATQSKLGVLATGKEKVKTVAIAIMGVNKMKLAAGPIMDVIRKETMPIDSVEDFVMPMNSDEEEEEILFEDVYNIGEEIGESIFTKIHLAFRRTDKKKFAVKRVVRRELHSGDVAALNDEIAVLRALAHGDHVVRLQEVYEDPDTTFLVLEYIQGDVLIDRLIQKKKYTEFDAKELVRNLLLGVAHIHENRIANRNLTLENLILPAKSESDIKISDFEFAKKVIFPNSLRTQCGTQEFIAPEVLENRPAYDVSCDMWTVGVIVFLLLGGYYPFRGPTDVEVLRNVRYGNFEFRPSLWKDVSEDAKTLMRRMMTVDPQQRITAKDALACPWILADNSVLSADLSDSMKEIRKEVKLKFRGVVQTIIASKKLQMNV